MPDDAKSKDSRDRAKPGAPEHATADNDQRRFRGPPATPTPADNRRGEIGGEETSEDAPMDAEDQEFLKSK